MELAKKSGLHSDSGAHAKFGVHAVFILLLFMNSKFGISSKFMSFKFAQVLNSRKTLNSAGAPNSALKVSKSRKQFLVFSILPKNERKTKKNILRAVRINFLVFVHFLEELRIPKIAFEIY